MKDLIKKLLSGETIELSRNKGMLLPPEEKESLEDFVEAKIL